MTCSEPWRSSPKSSPRPDILEGLPAAQAAEPSLVQGDVADDLVRGRPGVVAEGPADRLADEEVAVGQVRLDAVVEEAEVDRAPAADLADDRAPPLPKVGGHRPLPQVPSHLLGMGHEKVAERSCRDLVDDVPPGTADDQLLVERQRIQRPLVAVEPVAEQGHRPVPFLAVARLVEEASHGIRPGCRVGQWMRLYRPLEDRLVDWRGHPAIGHRRLHVGLHCGGSLRVGGRFESASDRRNQRQCGRPHLALPASGEGK